MMAESHAMSDKAKSLLGHPWLVPDDALIGQNTQCVELNELLKVVLRCEHYSHVSILCQSLDTDCQETHYALR